MREPQCVERVNRIPRFFMSEREMLNDLNKLIMRKLVENSLLCFLSLVIFGTNDGVAQILLKDYDLIGKVKEMRQYHYIPLEDC